MIVCLCYGTSEAAIEDLVAQGNESVAAITRVCGAGSDCGACRGQIEEIIEAASEQADRSEHCRFLRVLPSSSSRGRDDSSRGVSSAPPPGASVDR